MGARTHLPPCADPALCPSDPPLCVPEEPLAAEHRVLGEPEGPVQVEAGLDAVREGVFQQGRRCVSPCDADSVLIAPSKEAIKSAKHAVLVDRRDSPGLQFCAVIAMPDSFDHPTNMRETGAADTKPTPSSRTIAPTLTRRSAGSAYGPHDVRVQGNQDIRRIQVIQ